MRKKLTPLMVVALLCAIFATAVHSQTTHPGIALYREGKNAEAIASLSSAIKSKEYKNNAEVWNYLGLAQARSSDAKNARKSLEKAVKLSPADAPIRANLAYIYLRLGQESKARSMAEKVIALDPKNLSAYYLRGSSRLRENKIDGAQADVDTMIAIDPSSPHGYVLASQVSLEKVAQAVAMDSSSGNELQHLQRGIDLLKSGSSNCKEVISCDAINSELADLHLYYEHFSKKKSSQPTPTAEPTPTDPNVTPLKITTKPRPAYTDTARSKNVQGTIVLLVLFRSDGRIGRPLALKRLGSGLDESAFRAASAIRFEPKRINGKPVSVVRPVEFSFAIY